MRRANGGVSAMRGSGSRVWRQELGGSWAGAMQWCSRPQLIVCVRRCGGSKQCSTASPVQAIRGASAGVGESLLRARWGGTTANYRISNVLLRMAILQ